MAVTMENIKRLRAMTGAGMLDVRSALQETDGDLDKAAQLLRERGIAKAAKKADSEAGEGLIGSYIQHNGRNGTIVVVNCVTDIVAHIEVVQTLARNNDIHVA